MTHTDDALVRKVRSLMRSNLADAYEMGRREGRESLYGTDAGRQMDRMADKMASLIRAHDEQSALNCGHCSEPDEIACACQIKERDDE